MSSIKNIIKFIIPLLIWGAFVAFISEYEIFKLSKVVTEISTGQRIGIYLYILLTHAIGMALGIVLVQLITSLFKLHVKSWYYSVSAGFCGVVWATYYDKPLALLVFPFNLAS